MRQQLKHVISILSEGITTFNGADKFPPKVLKKMLKALNQMPGEAQRYVKSGRDPRFNHVVVSELPSSLQSSIKKAAAFSVNHRWIGVIKDKDEYITPKSLHHELAHLKFPTLGDGVINKILKIVADDGQKIVRMAYRRKPLKESPKELKKVADIIDTLGYKKTEKRYSFTQWKFQIDGIQSDFDDVMMKVLLAVAKIGYKKRYLDPSSMSIYHPTDEKMPEVSVYKSDRGKDPATKKYIVRIEVRKKPEEADWEIDSLENDIKFAKRSMKSIKKSGDPYFGLELDLMIPPSHYKKVAAAAGVKHLDDQYVTLAVHLYFARLGNYLNKLGEFAREEAVTYLVTTDKKVSKTVFS